MNYTMEIEVRRHGTDGLFNWRTFSVTADEVHEAVRVGRAKANRQGFETRNVTGLRRGFTKDVAVAADCAELAAWYATPRERPTNFEPFPFNTFALIVGGANWVIARRTPNNTGTLRR